MNQDIYRIVLTLVLSGIVIFAWQYYRDVFWERQSENIEINQQAEKTEAQKVTIRKDLSRYDNCGHLKILVYPIYKTLDFFTLKTRNPGAALILLTLLIRLFLAPLAYRQIQGSKKMAALQDEIKKIKQKYEKNPIEAQKTMGALFRDNGIHPMGNIGLILLQIPIFIALYKIVREAHIFSGKPLGLWVQDLGAADPYYILPLTAGIVMTLGTRFSGDTGTQMPKWMTYICPIVFAGFLLNQPAALALYILAGGIFQLGMNIVSYGIPKKNNGAVM